MVNALHNALHRVRSRLELLSMAIQRRPKVKTATLTVRLDPKIKAAAEAAAVRQHRSLTSLLEVLILDHCRTLGMSPEHLSKEAPQ